MPTDKCRFVVSVDTEEDIWGWSSTDPITCTNVRELPRLARFFARLGVRPTFFVTYGVLSDASARAVIRELAAEEWIEIGCHVHPWNTPPYDDSPRRTMLYNYPPQMQAAKIATTTGLFEEVLQRRPMSFRAGRFGFGPATATCLIQQGYRVDSSVTPFFDWRGSSGGQDYIGAPLEIYRVDPESGVLRNEPDGPLIEVPLTSGYTRLKPDAWETAARFFEHGVVRRVHLGAIGSWALAFRRTILSPEAHTVTDMVALGRRVVSAGIGHLHLFFHSSSLVPGFTPFTQKADDVERLYDRTEEVLDRIRGVCRLDFASVREAGGASPDPDYHSVEEDSALRVVSSEASRVLPRPPAQLRHLDVSHPRGIRASLKHWARYAYWRLGGYRRFRRVDWTSVRRLVFVCTGNICRSPYAERVARAQSIEAVSLGVSTGLDGVADPTALRIAGARGVRLDEHRTTPLGNFEPHEGDLFIAMEPFQARLVAQQRWTASHQITLLGLWAPSVGPVIPDPYGGDDRRFAHSFSLIERGIGRMARRLERPSGEKPKPVPTSPDVP